MQTRTLAGAKPEVEKLEEASEIEALRAAYLSVAGNSGRVVSGKVMQESLHSLSNTISVHAEAPKPENPPVGSLKKPARYAAQNSAKNPVKNPVDVAIQTISQMENIADSQPNVQQTSIEQALRRGQEFAQTTIHTAHNTTRVAPPVETVSAPASRSSATQPAETRVEAAQSAPVPVTAQRQISAPQFDSVTQPQQSVQTGVYPSLPADESYAAQAARPVKLPKFLVAPEGEDVTTVANSTGKTSFGVSGNTKSSSIPLNLFSDLQPSRVKSVDTLIQEEDARQAAAAPMMETKPPETKPAREFFNTTKPQPTANGSASFLDYLNVPADTAAVKTVGDVPIEGETEWMDRYQRYESVWVKLFERPRLLLGVLGLGIVSCSVYIALGYWWFGGSPISQAAETVNLLNVQDDINAGSQDPTTTFNNIRSIQKDAHLAQPKNSKEKSRGKQENMLLAEAVPAGGLMGEPASTAASSGSGVEPIKTEATGRPDPFDPLVSASGDSTNGTGKEEETKKRDILLDLQYTGFIGDINSRDKVALIRVSDTVTGVTKTQIKKVGEAFPVDGEVVVLRGISKKALLLSAQGETRQLPLQQYVAVKVAAQADGSAAPSGAAPGGAPGSLPGSGGSSFAPPAGKGGNPANVSLNEPKN